MSRPRALTLTLLGAAALAGTGCASADRADTDRSTTRALELAPGPASTSQAPAPSAIPQPPPPRPERPLPPAGPEPAGVRDPAQSPSLALAAHLPPGSYELEAMDVAAVRAQLRLPAEADVVDRRERYADVGGTSRFDDAFLAVMSYDVEDGPFASQVDFGRVTAAASAIGHDGDVAVLATTQPERELREALRRQGYRPAGGGVLHARVPEEFRDVAAVALGDGLVVTASRAATARAALRRTRATGPNAALLTLMARTHGGRRVGRRYPSYSRMEAPCLRATAGAQQFLPGRQPEEVAFAVHGRARVVLDEISSRSAATASSYDVQEVRRAPGGIIDVRVGFKDDPIDHANAATIAGETIYEDSLVACPDARSRAEPS